MTDPDKIEKKLNKSLLEFCEQPEIQGQMAEAYHIWGNDLDSIKVYNSEEDISDETFSKFMDWFIHDFKKLDNGRRVIEEFFDRNNDTLDKDEASVIKDWIKSYSSYFEILEVDDDNYFLAADLFSGEQYRFYDKSVSSIVKPAEIISARPLKTGETYFFSSVVSLYPNIFKNVIIDHFNKEFELHKNAVGKDTGIGIFLKDSGFQINNYLENYINFPQILELDGEELLFASAIYKINSRDKVLNILSSSSEFSSFSSMSGNKVFYHLESLESVEIGANIEIEKNKLWVNCNTRSRLISAKLFLENILVDFIEHIEDRFKKIDSYMLKGTKVSFKLPKGFRSRKQLDENLHSYYMAWIDQPHSSLDGLTPRDAMKTPEGRVKLENVLFELEKMYESARKAGEPYYDIKNLREELLRTMN